MGFWLDFVSDVNFPHSLGHGACTVFWSFYPAGFHKGKDLICRRLLLVVWRFVCLRASPDLPLVSVVCSGMVPRIQGLDPNRQRQETGESSDPTGPKITRNSDPRSVLRREREILDRPGELVLGLAGSIPSPDPLCRRIFMNGFSIVFENIRMFKVLWYDATKGSQLVECI